MISGDVLDCSICLIRLSIPHEMQYVGIISDASKAKRAEDDLVIYHNREKTILSLAKEISCLDKTVNIDKILAETCAFLHGQQCLVFHLVPASFIAHLSHIWPTGKSDKSPPTLELNNFPWLTSKFEANCAPLILSMDNLPAGAEAESTLLYTFEFEEAIACPLKNSTGLYGFIIIGYESKASIRPDLNDAIIEIFLRLISIGLNQKKLYDNYRIDPGIFLPSEENVLTALYILNLTPTGFFEYITPSCVNIFGYTPDEFYSDPNLYTKIIHPDDLEMYHTITKNPEYYSSEATWRIIKKNGQVGWIRRQTYVIEKSGEKPKKIFGVVQEVTEKVLRAGLATCPQ
jgi:PAS domain-containing protein